MKIHKKREQFVFETQLNGKNSTKLIKNQIKQKKKHAPPPFVTLARIWRCKMCDFSALNSEGKVKSKTQ